jgi:hypothetical protein
MLLRYVADLHMETDLTLLCTLTVWCAVRFHDDPSVPNGILLGAVGMMATLTKGVIPPYLVIYGAIWFVRGLRAHRLLRPVFAMFVTMTLLLAPWTYRNYQVTGGRFVLLTPGASDSFLRGYVFTRTEFAMLRKLRKERAFRHDAGVSAALPSERPVAVTVNQVSRRGDFFR